MFFSSTSVRRPRAHHCKRILGIAILTPTLGVFLAVGQTEKIAHQGTATFSALSSKADLARDADRLDEAIALYRRALSLRPSWAEGWWSLGTIYYDRDAYAKAALAFEKFSTLQPQNGTGYAMLGLCEFELGRDELALRHIQRGTSLGLQTNPDLWHVVLFHEGVLLQRKGSFQAAQDTLEELCLQTRSSDKVADVLGMAMLRSNAEDPPPRGSIAAVVSLEVGRAECLAGQKKYDEAKPAFEGIVNQNPTFLNVHYAFGLFLTEIRDIPGAVEQFKEEIKNHPDHLFARLRIAAVDYKVNSAEAIPFAREAVKLDPQQPFTHYLLGLLLLDTDNYAGAIPELEIAEKGLPKEPKIYFALGAAYSRAGRRKEAAQARATFARLTDEQNKTAIAKEQTEPRSSGPEQIPLGDLPTTPH